MAKTRITGLDTLETGTPSTSTPGALAAIGTATAISGSDHVHAREDWHNASPTVSQTIPASVSLTITGLPLILASGVVYSIDSGAITVLTP